MVNFLNRHPEFPIVAHCAEYDRDKVLNPAFQRVALASRLPKTDRWRCTVEMAKEVGLNPPHKLDDLLDRFGFVRRHPKNPHNAEHDCQLTAKVYMELMKIKADNKSKLGFIVDK